MKLQNGYKNILKVTVCAVVFFILMSMEATAAPVKFTGTWRMEEEGMSAEIVITKQTARSFEFSFGGVTDQGNTGELEGVAVIKKAGIALYEEKDEYSGETVRVKFTWKDGKLIVDEENTFGLFGMGVYISGTYKRDR
jgi:hypothetical protein